MNTNKLKSFAQNTRLRLLKEVSNKLNYVLNSDSLTLRDYAASIDKLKKDIDIVGTDALIDKVAYTWFNRLMALRFMDANGFQPLQLSVISPVEGYTQPEILNEAMQGRIPEELNVDRQRIFDLLDGRINVANPQNEVFRMLLAASCNHLNHLFPFLFEKINDYTELLLPDDLISELSIINDFVNGMSVEDCQEVEIMGWLYQFYISELNAKLISSKKAYKKNELAPASQLFTPKWIVQYMVDNTLGQLWAEMNPQTKVIENLEYYITPEYKEISVRDRKPLEEITFFEPCVGSGHILAYAFDVFYKMYEEAGYLPSEIPFLILKHNLYGVDIDPRAAQIASFTLLMKARSRYRRFFRKIEQEHFVPNIHYYENFEDDAKFKNATTLGSLIRVTEDEVQSIQVEENTLFAEKQQKLKDLYQLLGRKYDIVVTNPPYINSSRMEPSLKKYVNSSFADTKTDLFACFVLRNLELTNDDGLTGYMTPFVWMFISSYEKLRKEIISNHFINNLIQLEYSGFDGATVPICTFTLRNKHMDAKGSYIRLSDFKGSQNQAPKTLEAIQNPDCGWFYTKNQKEFNKIPGCPIGYWLGVKMLDCFSLGKLGDSIPVKSGMSTTNNQRFLRYWVEVSFNNFAKTTSNLQETKSKKEKWYPIKKGGEYSKWIGDEWFVINWKNNGEEMKNAIVNNPSDPNTKHWSRRIFGTEFFFKKSITWTKITPTKFSARFSKGGSIYTDASNGAFPETSTYKYLGLFNSNVFQAFIEIISPTLNFKSGDVSKVPLNKSINQIDEILIKRTVDISLIEWDSRETSWDFLQNELIRLKGQDTEETIELYKAYWSRKFFELHQNEEELNAQFIEIYGLQEELTPDVPLDEITILKDELVQKELKQLSDNYSSNWQLNGNEWTLQNKSSYPKLPFDEKELVQQFISYAVGCMFGRYSLDKEGLILANQGEGLSHFLDKVEKQQDELSFVPDKDNIIPVLDNEWFADDIVAQFIDFIRTVWGDENVQQNIAYIEKRLGKTLRNYFYRDFYTDHVSRYKKRPIYWMISSPSGAFQALIYMHRYTENTISDVLNGYLRPYIEKLENRIEHLNHVAVEGTAREKTAAEKEIVKIEKVIDELRKYDREVLYPLATERISIDLDDGVLVNYNRFEDVLKRVAGLNDAAARKKVKGFDWVVF